MPPKSTMASAASAAASTAAMAAAMAAEIAAACGSTRGNTRGNTCGNTCGNACGNTCAAFCSGLSLSLLPLLSLSLSLARSLSLNLVHEQKYLCRGSYKSGSAVRFFDSGIQEAESSSHQVSKSLRKTVGEIKLYLVHAAVDAVVGSASTSADSCDEQGTDTLKLAQAESVVFATLTHCLVTSKYSLSCQSSLPVCVGTI